MDAFLERYRTTGWRTVPVYRPDLDTGGCSCDAPRCPKPGKHPVERFWPDGSTDRQHFVGRNLGVKLGPDSQNIADADLDCREAILAAPFLLPPTECAFGRDGKVTHSLYTVTDGTAIYAKLTDPVLSGNEATIIELRWPEWDETEKRFKHFQTVFPPSLHISGHTIEWFREGHPTGVCGADLVAASGHIAAAVVIARYARPRERHGLVLLIANLLVRAKWEEDDRIVRFMTAVFTARNDADKVAKIADGEGLGAVKDARKRLNDKKHMMGLPALQEMLDVAIDNPTLAKVVGKIKEWLAIPDMPTPKFTFGGGKPGPGTPAAGGGTIPTPRIPPFVPFPTHLLPTVPRAYVEATAAAMNCDPSYSALPVLAALGAAVGSSHVASPKRGWKEPPYIWALPIGRSGAIKSPPYRDVEDLAEDINDRLEREFEIATAAYEGQLDDWNERRKAAKESGDDPGPKPKPPVKKSFIKGDVTIEALVGTLQDNPRGLLIGQDELSAWIGGFVKYAGRTGASDLPRWLQLSNAGSINYTRKTGDRKEVRIRGVGVSVAGTIQPKILARVLNEEFRASGFLARLLLAMPPWRKRLWTEAEVDEPVRKAFGQLLEDLFGLSPAAWPDGRPCPHLVRLTDEAKKMFIAFYNANGTALETADEDMSAVMSKLEGYALRFALIFHCCRLKESAGRSQICGEDMAAAIQLTMWFRDEAERVYMALGETPELQAARLLFEVVRRLADRHGGRITGRQLQRSNQRKYQSAGAAEAALESLVAAGLGEWEELVTRGHPIRAFVPHDLCDKSDKRGEEPDEDEGSDEPPFETMCDKSPPGPKSDNGEPCPNCDVNSDFESTFAESAEPSAEDVSHCHTGRAAENGAVCG